MFRKTSPRLLKNGSDIFIHDFEITKEKLRFRYKVFRNKIKTIIVNMVDVIQKQAKSTIS